MKYLALIVAAINVYMGLRAFLNVIDVLQTSKYSQVATAGFALLFLTMGFIGFYFSIYRSNNTLSLAVGLGPWVIALIFLFFTMLLSDYK